MFWDNDSLATRLLRLLSRLWDVLTVVVVEVKVSRCVDDVCVCLAAAVAWRTCRSAVAVEVKYKSGTRFQWSGIIGADRRCLKKLVGSLI